ncbi:MAG: alpha/beta hydrolase [Chloroflexi bacterium]|nr:MAG: alpha/beta hydrolase [Chloroflexota bacterium]
MPQPIYEFGGAGRVIHIALANGFPPETYKPLLDPFTAQYRVVSLPPRALWPDAGSPQQLRSWRDMAADLLTGMRDYNLSDVIAIGHSMGAVATMLAAIAEPARFRGIILLDPVFRPSRDLLLLKIFRAIGLQKRLPLVQGALDRRSHFDNLDEAFDYWRGKALFKHWPDELLWHYTKGITRPAANGGVELAWSPQWEAQYYMTVFTESWREIPKLRDLLPVLMIRGGTSTTLQSREFERIRQLLPNATLEEVPGYGHLFPHDDPETTRRIISDWLPIIED